MKSNYYFQPEKYISLSLGLLVIMILFSFVSCKDEEWDPNDYIEIVLDYDHPFYHFTYGKFSRDSMPEDIDGMGIINEAWCTDQPALCGQFETTGTSSFATFSRPVTGAYSLDCKLIDLNKTLVFRLTNKTYALVKIVDDTYGTTEDGQCEHKITLQINYPAFPGYKEEETDGKIIAGTFTDDRDNHVYQTVRIGDQLWFAENLAYLPVLNGPGSLSITEPCLFVWDTLGHDYSTIKNTSNYKTYGALYNWAAAQQVCPSGWHLPTEIEWEKLATYISYDNGGYTKNNGIWEEVGRHLKSESGWREGQVGSDTYGFKALPGGLRNINEFYMRLGVLGSWWTASESRSDVGWTREIDRSNHQLSSIERYKIEGYSVRCVKKVPDEELTGLSDASWKLLTTVSGLVVLNLHSFDGMNQPLFLAGYRPSTMWGGHVGVIRSGSSVENISTPNQEDAADLFCYSSKETFMVTRSAKFSKLTDGYPPTFGPLVALPSTGMCRSIWFTTPSRGFIATDTKAWRTMDGGNNWSEINIGNSGFSRVVFTSMAEGFFLGKTATDEGIIYKTNNATSFSKITFPWTWYKESTRTAEYVYGLHFLNPYKGWICGEHGQIVATENGGLSWKIIRSGSLSDPTLFDIHFPSQDEGWACGQNGTLLYTKDGGKTWTKINIGETNDLIAIEFNGPYCGWVATSTKIYQYINQQQHGNQFY